MSIPVAAGWRDWRDAADQNLGQLALHRPQRRPLRRGVAADRPTACPGRI